jgi:hypothetical protein
MVPLVLLYVLVNCLPTPLTGIKGSDERCFVLATSSYCPVRGPHGFSANNLNLADFYRPMTLKLALPSWTVAFDNISQEIVVLLKGSSNVKDWIRNIDILQEFIFAGIGGYPTVQRGFLNFAIQISKEMDKDLTKLIQKYPAADIHYVGHSQGGALAMLVPVLSTVQGALLSNRVQPSKVKVTTFGAPAVGNRDWVELYKSKGFKKTRRIVNALDVVPKLLGQVANYYHYEDELLCINDDAEPVTLEEGRGKCSNRYSSAGILKRSDFVQHHIQYLGHGLNSQECQGLGLSEFERIWHQVQDEMALESWMKWLSNHG